ncbi:MAG TPA: hypothetical protein DCQ83_05850 [Fibrobacteres bacterium]|jgi:NDP-sugar pyrophosphorylase family protein|nr:hypothetical protein [Fibrobacterota bacterium]
MSLAAFLLCAGYGQRLKPLTERLAKPAIPFQGKSALEINKRRIDILKPEKWLANTHHLPEQIEAICKRLNIETLQEPEILGTGGCIANAASILKHYDHFLVHNADLIHSIDLQRLFSLHQSSEALATLAGVRHPDHNSLSVDSTGRLQGIHGYEGFTSSMESSRFTFAGIAFYRKDFLDFVTAGVEDIKRHWTHALKSGEKIQVVDCAASAWHDFGTPQGLWEAAKFMMETTGEFGYQYPSKPGEKPYVSNEAGQEGLPEGLKNVLVYEEHPGVIPSGTYNIILGVDFDWKTKASS